MNIVLADDERLALELLRETVAEACPNAALHPFSTAAALLDFARQNPCDIAFLDVQLRNGNGVELAQRLKELHPKINIIFVTGFESYTGAAISMHASGYILKPVTAEKIARELAELRHPLQCAAKPLLTVRCFGNFSVFTPQGEAVHFSRSRAQEAFAYLVYLRGAGCTIKELAARLFEDGCYDKAQQDYMQKIISAMMQSLRLVGAEQVVSKGYNNLAVNPALLDCDYYRFIEHSDATPTFLGEFMSQYSWAEATMAYLDGLTQTKQT